MRYFFILVTFLLLFISCESNVDIKEKKFGELNQSCLEDKSCNQGLICSNKNICLNALDECKKISCSNHGSCIVEDNKLGCKCDVGYYADGYFCKSNNICEDITCSNHGSCIVEDNRAKCSCEDGYHSLNLYCISDNDPCKDIVCSNHGFCELKDEEPECNCEDGFYSSGLSCINESQFCIDVDCSNHGSCIVDGNIASCECFLGYTGVDCEINIDDCEVNPCLHEGRCSDKVAGYECSCKNGYTGVNCEINIDDCEENPCLNGGFCIDGVNSYSCDCKVGYRGNLCDRCDDGFILEDGNCVIKLSTMEKNIKVEMPFKDYTQYSVVGEENSPLNINGEATVKIYSIFSSLYIIDNNENIVAIYYGSLEDDIKITTETTALGVIFAIPIDWKKYQEPLDEITILIKDNNNFNLLKERINNIVISKPEFLLTDNYVKDLIITIIDEVKESLTEIVPSPNWLDSLNFPLEGAYISGSDTSCEYIEISNSRNIPYGISLYDLSEDKIISTFSSNRPLSILGTSSIKYVKDSLSGDNNAFIEFLDDNNYLPVDEYGINKMKYYLGGEGNYVICFGRMFSTPELLSNTFENYLNGDYNIDNVENNLNSSINLTPLKKTMISSRIRGTISLFTTHLFDIIIGEILKSVGVDDDILTDEIVNMFNISMHRLINNQSINLMEVINQTDTKGVIDLLINVLNDIKHENNIYANMFGISPIQLKIYITILQDSLNVLLSRPAFVFELTGTILDLLWSEGNPCYHLDAHYNNNNECFLEKRRVEDSCDEMNCDPENVGVMECKEGVCIPKESRCLWSSHCPDGKLCMIETHTCEIDPCENISYDNSYQHCENGIIKTNDGLCTTNSDCDNDKICNIFHFCVPISSCNNVTCSYNGRCIVENNEAKCSCYNGYHTEGLNCIINGECTTCQQENIVCGSLNDNCGNQLNCGSCNNGYSCIDGSCVSDCSSHDHQGCFNDDIYWYDSCNTREELATDCINEEVCRNNQNSFECSDSCTPHEQEKESCIITHGIGEKARFCNADGISWSSWSSCNVKSCDNGYTEDNNQCIESCNPNDDPLYGGNDAPSSYCACYDDIYLTLNSNSSLLIDGSYCSIDQGDIYQIRGDTILNYNWTIYLGSGTGKLDIDVKCNGKSIGASALITNNSCSNTTYGAALCKIENSQVLSFTYDSNVCPKSMDQFIWISLKDASPSYRIIIREGD